MQRHTVLNYKHLSLEACQMSESESDCWSDIDTFQHKPVVGNGFKWRQGKIWWFSLLKWVTYRWKQNKLEQTLKKTVYALQPWVEPKNKDDLMIKCGSFLADLNEKKSKKFYVGTKHLLHRFEKKNWCSHHQSISRYYWNSSTIDAFFVNARLKYKIVWLK